MKDKNKPKELRKRYEDHLVEQLKDIPPREFISFEILKSHLPIFLDGDKTEKDLDKIMDYIALELITAYKKNL